MSMMEQKVGGIEFVVVGVVRPAAMFYKMMLIYSL